MANKGVAPVDTSTAVGQFRVDVGDTDYKALVPAETGFGDFQYFSDLELQSALDATGGVPRMRVWRSCTANLPEYWPSKHKTFRQTI